MPLLDDCNAVGCVQLESRESGNYSRNFMVVDFSTSILRLYLEEAEFASDLSPYDILVEINCQYITKVGTASTRPKVLNCLEIGTTSGSYFLSVDSAEERDEWIDSITKASMRHGSKQGTGSQRPTKDVPTGYETKVVGGVVQRMPIAASNGERLGDGAEGAAGRPADDSKVRRRGFPRIIKAGHGIKLGAVMKNWKRRFFILTEISLSYYKTLEELEPIKSVSVGEVTSVSPKTRELTGKEHLFEVVTPNRTFYVQVDSNQDMEEWVRVFNDLLRTIKPSLQQQGQVNTSSESSPTSNSDEQISIV